ncbi:hypothetical protein [Paraburkholderia fungorum]|uniref:hypothetical protein n=1 Tax=Paraburkholderia fungorum TaxID=134537 RepID=UPI002091F7ED|nr:hypothetical protein [Paraburkholderia fungorum]USU18838.1 hypothetical protein NFE55_32300 [Paraburkholderia fungorum]USU29166.1 hypothetical protein NFS19_29270 [Paraburkholderia fungorum]
MLSGLTKLLDKAFVLGFFLPSLLGILGFLYANRDVSAFCELLNRATADSKELGNLVSVLALVWVFAILLMVLNSPIYKVLEGYVWPLRRRYWTKGQCTAQSEKRKEINTLREALRVAKNNAERLGRDPDQAKEYEIAETTRLSIRRKLFPAEEQFSRKFPPEERHVLATSFGNALRAFESYSTEMYGADSIYLWPRLLAVIPHDYQSVIADARAYVDFFVGLVLVACITGISTLVRALYLWLFHLPLPAALIMSLLLATVVAALVAWGAYQLAIVSARRWGDVVKSAFDLYLPALAQSLGYVLPESSEGQRRFWKKWSQQFKFHWPVDTRGWKRITPTATETRKESAAPPENAGDDSERSDGG